ncbi:hypothetical protein H4O21_23440, partial [Oceanospirillum sp. D5]|nr:hypothetical protein [Oceanospirillum sediminis]
MSDSCIRGAGRQSACTDVRTKSQVFPMITALTGFAILLLIIVVLRVPIAF